MAKVERIMYFKKLVGEKCYLSPIDANDAEKFTEWLNDLDVTVIFTEKDTVTRIISARMASPAEQEEYYYGYRTYDFE
ncbi:hypothetical protein FACS1894106_4870 [Spirochaetia bacterium]|nr:hypothetical protein FACS1894106_4870 [Spirochaetia bacterium]